MTDTNEIVCCLSHRTDPDRPRRAEDGSYLCIGHSRRLFDALTELAAFAAQADQASYDETVAAGHGAPTTGTKEPILPVHEGRVDHAILIRQQLASWCQLVAEERHVAVPDSPEPAVTAGFLRRHHSWIVGAPWIDDYAGEVLPLASRAHSLLNPSGVRRVPCPIGCPCGGVLEAIVGTGDDELQRDDLAPSQLVCAACGQPTSFAEAQAQSDTRRWASEDMAVLWATAFGRHLRGVTLRVWASRGHVQTKPQGSRVVYWLDDVAQRLTGDGIAA